MSTQSPSDWSLADAKIIGTETARAILAEAKSRAATSKTWATTYDWLAIAVGSGLRVSEVAHIEKDDVLPNRLMVTRRKKRKLSPAPIDVIPEIHEILKRRADAVEIGFIFPGNAAPCFIHRQKTKDSVLTRSVEQVCIGGHASLRTIQRNWRILVTDLGLYQYGRGIHSLRHTAITNVYKATKDILVAKTFAGHSNAAITERYCHLADLQDALAKVPRVL